MSKKALKKLPDTASELIRLAVKDLTEVEKMKKTYIVDMEEWFDPAHTPKGKCAVCFAGSVMARSCNLNPKSRKNGVEAACNVLKYEAVGRAHDKFIALDNFRLGFVSSGLNYVYPAMIFPRTMNINTCDYERAPAKFKKQMLKLANNLEAVGL